MILKKGRLPKTPHTEYYGKKGVLSLEEIHGSFGFSGPWSRKLHIRSYPTEQVKAPVKANFDFVCKSPAEAEILQPYHIPTANMPTEGDALKARKPVVYGPRTILSILKPATGFLKGDYFRNGEMHEIYFVQEGSGVLHSEYGSLPFRKDVYIIVPKGTTYRIDLKSKGAYLLLTESVYPITFAPHYFNNGGQATLSSPVVETEIEAPVLSEPVDKRGNFTVYVKHDEGKVTRLTLGHHPFDVVGWEGALYPFVFDIKNHHGIASEIHTAPPVHQTFQSGNVPFNGFSLCSFVPQMEGWHPKEIPAPYAHSNVDSDECMFFCNANYGARKGIIQPGSLTFHPGSVPHSPQGHAARNSMAARGTMSNRLAVMLDTYFESLKISTIGYKYRDKNYATSWNDANWKEDAQVNWQSESPSE